MAIKTDFFATRADGVNLHRTYSDADLMIRKEETGEIFTDAVDVEGSNFTYAETDIKITHPAENAPEITEGV